MKNQMASSIPKETCPIYSNKEKTKSDTMPNCFGIDLDTLSIAELLPPKPGAAIGAKISPITAAGRPLKIVLGTRQRPVRNMFEPSVSTSTPQPIA